VDVGSDYNDLIALKYQKSLIIGIYIAFKCHEGETERTNLERLLQALGSVDLSDDVFIVGDWNIDAVNSGSIYHEDLTKWCDQKGLSISHVGVTRARWVLDRLQESNIDFVVSNNDKFSLSKEHSTLSDHYILKLECFDYKVPPTCKRKIDFFNWRFDNKAARAFLSELLGAMPIMSLDSVEADYWIRACLIKTFRKFVKSRSLTVRNSNDVTSPKIVRLKNFRNKLRKRWSKNQTVMNYVELVRA